MSSKYEKQEELQSKQDDASLASSADVCSYLMSSPLLHPPAYLSPSLALRISQQAPLLLQGSSSSFTLPFLSSGESPERWTAYEHLLLSCLRIGDDKSARLCLEKLGDRFGATNERVMGLKGMYQEAVADDNAALERILKEYEAILVEDPTNMPIAKRRIAVLRSMSQIEAAISALVKLLDMSPTDAEAWSELSDLYLSQGLYRQAIFSLEEVLLITPNAWNIHARMGELIFISSNASASADDVDVEKSLIDSMRWFCRSIELCDDYLRGYYGLKLIYFQTSNRLLLSQKYKNTSASDISGPDGTAQPSLTTIQRLNQQATAKLSEIVRKSSTGDKAWDGYAQAEVIAARELLGRDEQFAER
ncbi:hypothetical protein FGG08_003658 [Glutinoglossum americanum]|uniref:ER membrane protein complex subunit 2 n=1 Tax=Glutinoglossum americanum TaxID=1670608 RepID=A0A9P8IAQ3_9PEZI|nr:hypothetical protein FGG08_003658 [Glutinoglossum americanum]